MAAARPPRHPGNGNDRSAGGYEGDHVHGPLPRVSTPLFEPGDALDTPPRAGPAPHGNGTPLADDQPHLTDHGNAVRLVRRHGRDLRYCHPWKRWLVWDGARWREDDTGEPTRRAVQTLRVHFGIAAAEVDAVRRQLEVMADG
jgi:hypothetical protein